MADEAPARPSVPSRGAVSIMLGLSALGAWALFVHEPPGCEFRVEEDGWDPEVSRGRWGGRDCDDEQRVPEMYT